MTIRHATVFIALFIQLGAWPLASLAPLWARSESIDRARVNNENILKLKAGLTKDAVVQIMGAPDKSEKVMADNRTLEVLYYRIQEIDFELNDKSVSLVPVVFERGAVIGWGEYFYAQTIKDASDVRQEINLRKEDE